ncbi:MAG: sulfatase [Verrucomicrobia bacterium]|jgi:N-sulfoglucosamine sulfohydrolase|nr:sulfatase [Verrucomicrobiota bacterium]
MQISHWLITGVLRLLLAVGCVVSCLNSVDAVESKKRPNILFAFADDWGRYASAYADADGPGTMNDVIKTPHFDRIAVEGVLFKNAFVTAPSCTPCRSSLLSGQYFFRTGRGAILQGAIWDSEIPSYPLILERAGYHIGETYKVWSPGSPVDAPYGAGKFGYQKSGTKFNQFSQNVTKMVRQGKSIQEAKQVLYNEVMGNFNGFLDARPEGEPFCYWFGPTLVHRKWIKGSGKDLWGIDPDDLKGKMPAFLPDVHEVREDMADYFGEIQAFDTALGLMLARLEAMGELDNTLVIVSGDHGAPGFPNGKCSLYDFGVGVPLAVRWGGGKDGRVVEDFINLMDLAPTFLEAAGEKIPKVMTGQSFVSILKSDKSGWVNPDRNWVVTGRERHVAKARAGQIPYPQRALRTSEYLYIVNFKPNRWPMGDPYHLDLDQRPSLDALTEGTFVTYADFDASPTKAWLFARENDPKWKWHFDMAFGKRPFAELYDVRKDPDQIHNLAESAEFALIRGRMHEQLMGTLRDVNDPRVMEVSPKFEYPPFAGE